jgi:regulator of sigma D
MPSPSDTAFPVSKANPYATELGEIYTPWASSNDMPERRRLTLVAALILKQAARSLDDEGEIFYPPSSVFLRSFDERGNKVRYISCSRMESALSHVVEDILASYDRVGGMKNTDAHNLPSKRAIGEICEDLLQILFPGFHDKEAIHKKSLPVLTRHRVSSVMERLEEQVRQSMQLCDARHWRGLARPSPLEFFQSIPEVREILHTDIEAAYEGDPAALNREESYFPIPSSRLSPFSASRIDCTELECRSSRG